PSPNGSLLSLSKDNTLLLWDVVSGRCVHTLEGHTKAVNYVAFSPDGRQIISGSYDVTVHPEPKENRSSSYHGVVRLWDVATGRYLQTFDAHMGMATKIGPEDWRYKDSPLSLFGTMVESVAFSPDGKLAVLYNVSSRSEPGLFEVASGKQLYSFK